MHAEACKPLTALLFKKPAVRKALVKVCRQAQQPQRTAEPAACQSCADLAKAAHSTAHSAGTRRPCATGWLIALAVQGFGQRQAASQTQQPRRTAEPEVLTKEDLDAWEMLPEGSPNDSTAMLLRGLQVRTFAVTMSEGPAAMSAQGARVTLRHRHSCCRVQSSSCCGMAI